MASRLQHQPKTLGLLERIEIYLADHGITKFDLGSLPIEDRVQLLKMARAEILRR